MTGQDLSRLKIDKSAIQMRRAKRGRGLLAGLAAFLLLMLVLYISGVFSKTYTVRVSSVTIMYPSQALSVLSASGYVVAQKKSAVSSKITGKLVSLMVEEGSKVRKGQVIARLDDSDLIAAKDQAEANLKTARFNLDDAQAGLYDARLTFKRNSELLKKNLIARADYDTAFANYRKALAGVDAAKAIISADEAAVRYAAVQIGYTYIRAPFDAVVLTKNADIGDIITPIGAASNVQASVVSIADMNSLQVEADVSESGIEKIWKGQPCDIELDALPGVHFRGQVHMIVPTADKTKATVTVKVKFLRRDIRVLPEMSARVAFLSRAVSRAGEKPRVVIDPASVLLKKDGSSAIFLMRGGRAIDTRVVTGGKMGDMLIVTSGVSPGDMIVVNPPAGLKNGSRIKPAS